MSGINIARSMQGYTHVEQVTEGQVRKARGNEISVVNDSMCVYTLRTMGKNICVRNTKTNFARLLTFAECVAHIKANA